MCVNSHVCNYHICICYLYIGVVKANIYGRKEKKAITYVILELAYPLHRDEIRWRRTDFQELCIS